MEVFKRKPKAITEKQVETKVCAHARKFGIDAYKQEWPGIHGAPDRLMITRQGHIFMIEFKRPGGKLSAHQSRRIAHLKDRNVEVHVIDNIPEGIRLIDSIASREELFGAHT